jgi:hypothetical protein
MSRDHSADWCCRCGGRGHLADSCKRLPLLPLPKKDQPIAPQPRKS